MKKRVSLLLVFIICISSFPFLAFAQGVPGEYTDMQKETIYSRYTYNENMLDAIFGDDTAVGYWNMVNDTEENGFLKCLIDASSWIIGEYPSKQDYAEILANLIMMQSGDIAEQVQNQSQYDDLKDGMDYAMDIVDIASNFVGGANLMEEISPIIDAVTDGTDVIIDNVEQAKYYETAIRDYTQSKLFLDAVSSYAENEELRATASALLRANDKLLESRLEYLADSSAILADYQAEFFVKNMSFELLKTADLYKTDETVKWYVDCGEKISKSVQSMFSGAKFAFRMTMLAGDIGFGTSDTFKRYQEMKIVSDIAGAIVEANHHVQTPSRYDSPDALNIIQTKCDYYKMLIVTHARGEYLVYQLLINDAGLLSDFRVLFDAFKEPGETTESWYNGQISVMLEYYDILNNMFVIEDETVSTTPPSEDHYETDSALGKYLAAAAKTTETGSWSEQLTLEADMSIAYESGRTKTKVTLTADSNVSNYVEDDLSQIEITSLVNMKVMGQTYAWSTEYYDGIAHYEYTEPFQRSESLEIPPDFFDFEASIPEEVSGNQIRFIVSGEEMTETGIAAVQQMSGVNNLECEDVEVIVTLNDSGSIDQIEMNFDASVEYQGYDADVTYKIQYTFS